MKKQGNRLGLWTFVGIMAVLLAAFLIHPGSSRHDKARHDLDHILGEADAAPYTQPAPPQLQDPTAKDPFFTEDMDSLFGRMSEEMDRSLAQADTLSSSFQVPNVELSETPSAYQLKVPLSNPDDEKNIELKVEPHRINISGQFSLTSPDGKTVLGSSSFMKAFSPAMEVRPDSVKKTVQNKSLLITIEKKTPGMAVSPSLPQQPLSAQPHSAPQRGLSPELQQKLQQNPQSVI